MKAERALRPMMQMFVHLCRDEFQINSGVPAVSALSLQKISGDPSGLCGCSSSPSCAYSRGLNYGIKSWTLDIFHNHTKNTWDCIAQSSDFYINANVGWLWDASY